MKWKMRFVRILVGPAATMVLLTAIGPLHAESVPQDAQQALLKGDWSEVLSILEKSDIKEADVPCRMVTAHACLATNCNNTSMLLFLSAKESIDLQLWSEWTKSLLQSNPQSPIALYLSADSKARQGKLKEAVEGFTKALEIKKDFALAFNARGVVKVLNNEWDEALMDFLQAAKCDPNLADAYANLGSYWVIREAPDGAIEAFNKAIELNPAFAVAYNGMGCAYFGKGEFEKATHYFSVASQLNPILIVAEINQGYASTYASQIVALINLDNKPGTTLESVMQQYSNTLKNQQTQLLKLLPSQTDQKFWGEINSPTNLSDNQLQSFVKDYGAQKVQIGTFLKMQELKSQMAIGYQKSPQSFIDKINLSNDMSSFSFYFLDLDKSVQDIWKKPFSVGLTERLSVKDRASPPKGDIIFCSPGKGPSGAFSSVGHIALSLGGGRVYEMPAQDDTGMKARSPRITTWDRLTQTYSSIRSVSIPGVTQNDIDRLVTKAEEVVNNPTGYYSEQYNVLNHNCIQSVKHLARDIGLDLGDPQWKISEFPWQFYTWLRIKDTAGTPVRKLSPAFDCLQQQVVAAGDVYNVEKKLNVLTTKYTTSPAKQLTSQIHGYYTSVDDPLTSIGVLASMVNKSIAMPLDGSSRRALVVSQDPFRADLQQQELLKYCFETKLVSPTSDIQNEAKRWGADVIIGIRGTSQIELPGIQRMPTDDTSKYYLDDITRKIPPPFPPGGGGGGAAVAPKISQPSIKQNWDWGKSFVPTYPKSSPGGISTEELARSFVDKGNWPVLTSFGLFYQTGISLEEE